MTVTLLRGFLHYTVTTFFFQHTLLIRIESRRLAYTQEEGNQASLHRGKCGYTLREPIHWLELIIKYFRGNTLRLYTHSISP